MACESTAGGGRWRLAAAVTPTTWRYLAVATQVRIVDGAAGVSLVALVVSLHGRVSDAAAGLLTALLTAPQLLGVLAAEPLARARDPRRVLAAAFVGLGVALSACGLLVEHRNLALAAVAAAAAGCAGPLVTGGLSAQSLTRRADLTGERRAEALDAATYGLGSTVGQARMALREVLVAIAGVGPLRRVLAATTIAALGTGGLPVVAVVFGTRLGGHTGGGPLLAAAFGTGGLAGSVALTVRPLRTEPECTTLTLMAAAGASVALCALAPDEAAAAVLFALADAVAAAQFTASLAVRSAYAPPGTRAHVYVTMASLKVDRGRRRPGHGDAIRVPSLNVRRPALPGNLSGHLLSRMLPSLRKSAVWSVRCCTQSGAPAADRDIARCRLLGHGAPDAGTPFGGGYELHGGATARLLAKDTGDSVGQPGNEPCSDLLAVRA